MGGRKLMLAGFVGSLAGWCELSGQLGPDHASGELAWAQSNLDKPRSIGAERNFCARREFVKIFSQTKRISSLCRRTMGAREEAARETGGGRAIVCVCKRDVGLR